MKYPLSKRRAQAGDTIVEVLVCIAVVAAVLIGAFGVSNHSTQAVQDTSEHTEAQQYVQAQLEMLRQYVQAGSNFATNNDCLIQASGSISETSAKDCIITQGGANFNQSIIKTGDTYKIDVEWDTVLGHTAHEDYYYRVYSQKAS